jgi:hypothetical protein
MMSPAELSDIVTLAVEFIALVRKYPRRRRREPIVAFQESPDAGVTRHEVQVFNSHKRLGAALALGDDETESLADMLEGIAAAFGWRPLLPVGFGKIPSIKVDENNNPLNVRDWISWPTLREIDLEAKKKAKGKAKKANKPNLFDCPVVEEIDADGNRSWKPHPESPPADETARACWLRIKSASGLYWVALQWPQANRWQQPIGDLSIETRIREMEAETKRLAALLKQDGKPVKQVNPAQENQIPMERRSRPVPKIRAAKALNLPGTDSAKRKALNQLIESGSITCHKETGNRFTFDRQQIPALPALGGQVT